MGKSINNKGSYAAHQNLIQEFKSICLSLIPGLHLFDRHVGLFYTKRGNPVQVSIPGMADVWGIYNGRLVEIEAKSGGASQSKQQKAWQNFCIKNGVIYIVVKNPEEDAKTLLSLLS